MELDDWKDQTPPAQIEGWDYFDSITPRDNAKPYFAEVIPNEQKLIQTCRQLPKYIYRTHEFNALRDCWKYSSSFLLQLYEPEVIIRMFNAWGVLTMTQDEFDYLQQLPDKITIFRGGDTASAAANAFTWTLNKSVAVEYSTAGGREKIVASANVRTSDVLALYFDDMEIVVAPSNLENVCRAAEQHCADTAVMANGAS